MSKLNWEKANRQELSARNARERRAIKRRGLREKANRQEAMAQYVAKHNLACFQCGTREAEWAKTGTNRRGRWAICLPCVKGTVAPKKAPNYKHRARRGPRLTSG